MGVSRHSFEYGGITSLFLGTLYGGRVDEMAVKDVEAVTVPGRNGVLHLDNHRWNERTQAYDLLVKADYSHHYAMALGRVRTLLGQLKGYQRLTDTFNPDEFALATFADAVEPESLAFRTMGIVHVTFNCRPERFLKGGEAVRSFSTAGSLNNPTGMPARPLLRVYGTGAGTVTVGNVIIYVDAINGYVDIDCDLRDCFKGSTNCNGDVRIAEFPVLGAGTTGISFTGSLTSVDVTPRWWRL